MNGSIRALLTEIVDFAGLFPPAGWDMETTVQEFSSYRRSSNQWLLGRLVVPIARLEEFETVWRQLSSDAPQPACRITALSEPNALSGHLSQVEAFQQEWQEHPTATATIDCIELRCSTAGEIRASLAGLPPSLQAYFEVPLDERLEPLLDHLEGSSGRAKIRTGGLSPDAIPSTERVATFIRRCRSRGIPFKATAGLHHPFRAEHPLTYQPESPRGTMHGFLNVFMAATLAWSDPEVKAEKLQDLLLESDPGAFRFEENGAAWKQNRLDLSSIEAARRFAISFGSCSFLEPVEDLKELGLI